jgi:hypothetical protein
MTCPPELCAGRDFILYFLGKLYKKTDVAGHPDNEVPMFFRVLLRIQKRCAIDNIKLYIVLTKNPI